MSRDHLQMKKVRIYLLISVVLVPAGCSRDERPFQPKASALEQLPFVYKMTVQQGNLVTEEMIDSLDPGMTKSQVRFLLGTPMLTDLFHTDRWDYTYTIRRGHDPMAIIRLTLLFENDSLVEVQGDLRPDPDRAARRQPTDLLVSVPDWEDNRGLFAKILAKLNPEAEE